VWSGKGGDRDKGRIEEAGKERIARDEPDNVIDIGVD